jgi:hypothetical protein
MVKLIHNRNFIKKMLLLFIFDQLILALKFHCHNGFRLHRCFLSLNDYVWFHLCIYFAKWCDLKFTRWVIGVISGLISIFPQSLASIRRVEIRFWILEFTFSYFSKSSFSQQIHILKIILIVYLNIYYFFLIFLSFHLFFILIFCKI